MICGKHITNQAGSLRRKLLCKVRNKKEKLELLATVKNIALITELLDKVSNLKEVEDMEIINIPDDVEADIGLKIKLKKGYDWLDVQHKINDIIWEIFEDKRELLAVYEEFKE